MRTTKFGAPFTIQVEPTEGCTLACWFCGLQAIRPDNGADVATQHHGPRSTPYKFMEVKTAARIASEIQRLSWNPRVEFAMHGEPTVNPNLAAIVLAFRRFNPKIPLMVTSNGSGITKSYQVEQLFAGGLDTLAIDDYQHAKFVPRIFDWLSHKWAGERGLRLYSYPEQKEGNPHIRTKEKRIIVIKDITLNTKGTHQLTNQGGNSLPPVSEPLVERCAKPFRELSIRWNGDVAICCDDWKGEYKIANVNETSLDAIWYHPRFEASRRALYAGNRGALNPCAVCNVRTYRNGLLPDKYGKMFMPELGKIARNVLNEDLRCK